MMMIVIFIINTIFILNLRELAFPHQYQFDGNSNLVYTIIRQGTDTKTQKRIKRFGFGIFLLSDSTSGICRHLQVLFEKHDVHIINNQEKDRVPPTGKLALRLFLHQVGIANNSKSLDYQQLKTHHY